MSCQSADMEFRLLTLFPDRMNIYADRGNAVFLQRRCEWRGIKFSNEAALLGDEIDPEAHDLFYIGGGQDSDQRAVAEDLLTVKRDSLSQALTGGAQLLAVCGGYQLLGHSYSIAGEQLPGLGLAGFETVRPAAPRLVGNVIIETALEPHPAAGWPPLGPGGGPLLVGFENHGGRTTLGTAVQPLGRVIKGHGNNGSDQTEGILAEGIIGTYLHGPLLPKNWWLADHLIATALERRYGAAPELAALDDELEQAANARARAAA